MNCTGFRPTILAYYVSC